MEVAFVGRSLRRAIDDRWTLGNLVTSNVPRDIVRAEVSEILGRFFFRLRLHVSENITLVSDWNLVEEVL